MQSHVFNNTVTSFEPHHTEEQTFHWAEPCRAITFTLHVEDLQTVASQGLLEVLNITNEMFYLHSNSKEGQVPPVRPLEQEWHTAETFPPPKGATPVMPVPVLPNSSVPKQSHCLLLLKLWSCVPAKQTLLPQGKDVAEEVLCILR